MLVFREGNLWGNHSIHLPETRFFLDALMPQASFTDESIHAVGFASAMPMCYADGAVGGPGGPGSGYFDAWDGSNMFKPYK